MPSLNIRNISPETHRALKARATSHGRSVEAELRKIVEAAVTPRVRVGSEMAAFWKQNADFDLVIERVDEQPRKVSFE